MNKEIVKRFTPNDVKNTVSQIEDCISRICAKAHPIKYQACEGCPFVKVCAQLACATSEFERTYNDAQL